ncbi:MAG: MFS transporter [Firmicutes bacterium]|nr:MFS transporter [Bacillota bacterium]
MKLKNKLGYSAASVTDAANFTFMNSYILFFLTTVCNVNPGTAGTITVIGTIISSVWSPIVGFLCDRCRSRFGRRRPFLMLAMLPLLLSLFMCFIDIGFTGALRNIYYCIGVTLFWCSFSTFYSPWLTLAAELTDDYNERTSMRSITFSIAQAGTLLGMAVPPLLVEKMTQTGLSTVRAWTATALFIGLTAGICLLITIISTSGKDIPLNKKETTEVTHNTGGVKLLFKEYWEVIQLKPMIIIILMSLGHMTAQGIFFLDRAYMFEYNLGLTTGETSLAIVLFSLSCLILTSPITVISKKLDKRTTLVFLLCLYAALVIIYEVTKGISDFSEAVILSFAFAIGNSAFWQLMPVMLYDVCEYDEWENGRRREGVIVSVQPLLETICSGLSAFVLGLILEHAGFDGSAEAQTESALRGVELSFSIVPAVLMLFTAAMTILYPISRKTYERIKNDLNRGGKDE